jgi:hypothetical protein
MGVHPRVGSQTRKGWTMPKWMVRSGLGLIGLILFLVLI